MKRLIEFLKRRYLIFLAILVVIILAFIFLKNGNQPPHDFIIVERRDVVQGVSVTGRVEPAEEVDLSFNTSGKIKDISFEIGDEVKKDSILARLDAVDALLELEKARVSLEDLIDIDPLDLARVENDLKKAEEDVLNAYSDAFDDLIIAFSEMKDVLTGLEDLYDGYLRVDNDSDLNDIGKGLIKDARHTYKEADDFYEDSFNEYEKITRGSSRNEIESMLDQALDVARFISQAAKEAQAALDYKRQREINDPDSAKEAWDDVTDLSEIIDEQVAALISAKDKILNTGRTLEEAKLEFEDIALGPDKFELRLEQLNVEQKEKVYQDHFIFTPFEGIVTEVLSEIGASVAANQKVISLISLSLYEIEANVPEADVAKIKVGDKASLTLDAFGQDIVFEAEVSSIEPAATIIDGVATYKTILVFLQPDPSVKTGMTADIDILGERAEKVLAVPARAIIREGGEQFVSLLKGADQVEKVKVETGLRGSDGFIEIKAGLSGGEKVITFSR
jgi:HlyD family secretion protein